MQELDTLLGSKNRRLRPPSVWKPTDEQKVTVEWIADTVEVLDGALEALRDVDDTGLSFADIKSSIAALDKMLELAPPYSGQIRNFYEQIMTEEEGMVIAAAQYQLLHRTQARQAQGGQSFFYRFAMYLLRERSEQLRSKHAEPSTDATDAAMAGSLEAPIEETHGGIDLDAKKMSMDVEADGPRIEMHFDPAMMTEFQNGNFTGVQGIILRIVPLESPLPLLGYGDEPPLEEDGNDQLAKIDTVYADNHRRF